MAREKPEIPRIGEVTTLCYTRRRGFPVQENGRPELFQPPDRMAPAIRARFDRLTSGA